MFQKIKKFFSIILKSKRLLIFLISATSITIGLILPQYAFAFVLSALEKIGKIIVNSILAVVGTLILGITGIFFGIGKELLGLVIKGDLFWSYTKMDNPVIRGGWTATRDVANMFIVLGFVVVGIATILRIKDYQAQQTLPRLIIVAILINFSLVICGLVIDFFNLLMDHFLSTGGALSNALQKTISDQVGTLWTDKALSGDPFNLLCAIVGIALYNIVGFFVLMLYALLFLARYVALWILVALSPLAFVCYVFNFTKSYFNFWLKNFIQWCLVGVFGALFIYLGDAVIVELLSGSKSTVGTVVAGGVVALSGGAAAIPMIAINPVTWMPLIFMIVGFMATLQSSAIGAGIVTNIGKAAAGKAKGAIGKSQIAQKAKDFGVGALERAGLVKKGTLAKDQQARAKEALDRAKANFAKNPDEVTRLAGTKSWKRGGWKGGGWKRGLLSDEDRQANAIVAAMNGRLDMNNELQRANFEKAVMSGNFNEQIKEIEKKNPNFARYNEPKIKEIMSRPGHTGGRPAAEQIAIRERVQSLSPHEYANLSAKSITPEVFSASSEKQISAAGKHGSSELIAQFKKYNLRPGGAIAQTPERQAFVKYYNSMPKGSPERKAAYAAMKKLATDANFA